MNSGNVVEYFLILCAHCTAYPFVASAAVLIASFLEVTHNGKGSTLAAFGEPHPYPTPRLLASLAVLLARSPG